MAKLTAKSPSVGRHRAGRGGVPVSDFGTPVRVGSSYARHIGRVGALAVALGVGVAVVTGQGMGTGVAWAQDGSDSGDNSHSAPSSSDEGSPSSDPGAGGGEQLSGSGGGSGSSGASSGSDTGGASSAPSGGMNVGSSGGADTSTNDSGQSTDTSTHVIDSGDDAGSTGVVNPPSTPDPTSSAPTSSAPTPPSTSAPAPATSNPTAPQNNTNSAPTTGTPAPTSTGTVVDQTTVGAAGSSSTAPTGSPVVAPLAFTPSGGSQNLRTFSAAAGAPTVSTLATTPVRTEAQSLPGVIVSVVTSIVAAFLSPFLGSGPSTPAEPPLLWALLALVRREFFNSTPTAAGDTVSTAEDVTKTIDVLANDADDDPLTVISVTQPTNGTVTINPDGTLKYVPKANWSGTETFSYTVSDADAGSHIHGFFDFSPGAHQSKATVTVTVTPVNDAPVATGGSYTVAEDATLTVPKATGVLVGDTDVDNTAAQLKAVVGTAPTHGTLTLADDGSFVYKPTANYNGADSFTYKTSDGTAQSTPATVNITVTPVNDAPVAAADSYSTNENTPLTIAAPGVLGNDSDVDNTAVQLKAIIVANAAHGNVALNDNGSFTYTPNTNYAGTDSFTYKANDGAANSNTTTVNITINDVSNTAPEIINQFTPHEGYQNVLFTTPDGTRILQSESLLSQTDHPVVVLSLIDAETGELVGSPVTLAGSYTDLSFNQDRSRAYLIGQANGTDTSTFAVVDATTGMVVGQPVTRPGQMYSHLSADGNRVYLTTNGNDVEDGTFTVLDARTGATIGQSTSGNVYRNYVDESDEHAYLFSYDEDSDTTTFSVVDGRTGTVLGEPVEIEGSSGIDFTEDGSRGYIYADSEQHDSRTFAIVDTASGTVVGAPITVAGRYSYPYVSEAGSTAIFVSDSATDNAQDLTVIDMTTGTVLGTPVTLDGSYSQVEFDDENKRAYVVGQSNGEYSFVELDTGTGAAIGTPIAADGTFSELQRSEDGKRVYLLGRGEGNGSGYMDVTLRVVDTETGAQLGQTAKVRNYVVDPITFNADGTRVIITGVDNTSATSTIVIINTDTGATVFERSAAHVSGIETNAGAADDGSRAYVFQRDYYGRSSSVEIIDTTTGATVGEPISIDAYDTTILFSTDGKRLYTEDMDSQSATTLQVYSLDTGEAVGDPFTIDGTLVYQVLTSDDGRFDYVRSLQQDSENPAHVTSEVTILKTATAEVIDSFGFDGGYGDMETRLIGDRNYLYATSWRNSANDLYSSTFALLDPDTGRVLGAPVTSAGELSEPILSADGTRLYLQQVETVADGSTRGHLVVLDPETGAQVTIPGVTGELAGFYPGQYYGPTTSILFAGAFDSPDDPDLASIHTVVLLGGGEGDPAIALPGALQRYWFSEDGSTMYVLTNSAGYIPQINQPDYPAGVTSYLTAVDVATGTTWAAGPVSIDGVYPATYYYQNQGVIFNDDKIYLTTQATSVDGVKSTQSTVIDALTGAKLVSVDLEGTPAGGAVLVPGGTRVLQMTDIEEGEVSRLSVIDMTTGDVVGQPLTFDGARRGIFVSEDGSRAVVITQAGWIDTPWGSNEGVHGPTTFTMIDTRTGAVIGEPLVVDGSISGTYFNLGEDGDRAYVSLYVHDQTDSNSTYTYTSYVLDTSGGTTTTI